ncbi:Hypothetical predicted protein [Mytilus galloprovincialis]|uniref:NAD(P)(+)--arginine ADP-ribosyltransferase n=1 Tax=Mytilus galloprovincialis TaxID=29158 RepID=A0A8B6D485_MYTGA|nr:Hypothetical predicted protein [Mytilus galloprovincialis]
MKRLGRVIVWLIIETIIVSPLDTKTTNEVDPLHNISKTDERIHRYKRSGVESQDCAASIRDNGLSLINFGIKKLAPGITINGRFYEAVEDMYKILEKNEKIMKDKVGKYLVPKFPLIKSTLFSVKNFQKSFIFTYSSEYGYRDLNKALRDHNCANKVLTDSDKALAPYAAALMAILMHWDELPSTTGTAYRGSTITDNDLNTYRSSCSQSHSIVWLNFASTSTKNQQAFPGNVQFNINNINSEHSKWKPKLICNCSKFAYECEALYPPGSVFNVDEVTGNSQKYAIDLTLRDNEPTAQPGRKRRSASPDFATKSGFCYIGSVNSSWSRQINMWNVLVLGILGKFVSIVIW